jgi:hypothetical protein
MHLQKLINPNISSMSFRAAAQPSNPYYTLRGEESLGWKI